jgi:hypothetical protein
MTNKYFNTFFRRCGVHSYGIQVDWNRRRRKLISNFGSFISYVDFIYLRVTAANYLAHCKRNSLKP